MSNILKKCEEIWKIKNTWGLSYEDLIKCSYSHGVDGKGRCNGFDDKDGDTVYISPEGYHMTRSQCTMWMRHWMSFRDGFITACEIFKIEE